MFNAAGGGYDAAFWELPYNKILGCNIVLDCLDDMTGEESLRENLRGEAFVLRSLYYLMMVNMLECLTMRGIRLGTREFP